MEAKSRAKGGSPGGKVKKESKEEKPSKAPEFVYRKTGKAFKCLGNIAALNTNCRVWLLSEDEERELGESVGDILLELGLADTMAAKIVFAVGTVSAVVGAKTVAYLNYRASLPKRPAVIAAVGASPAAPPPNPVEAKVPGAAEIPEAKPGVV